MYYIVCKNNLTRYFAIADRHVEIVISHRPLFVAISRSVSFSIVVYVGDRRRQGIGRKNGKIFLKKINSGRYLGHGRHQYK